MAVPHDAEVPAAGAPAFLATDAELAAHAAAADPHTAYQLEAAHTLAQHTAMGLATGGDIPTAINDHEAEVDPHTGYVLESAHTLAAHNTLGMATQGELDAVDAAKLDNTGGAKDVVNTVAASGAATTLNLSSGNIHDVTLTANCTISLTGATNGVGCWMTLILRQDGTGGRTVTWPGSVSWAGGSAPTLSTGAGQVDVLTLFSLDGGTTWHGSVPPLTETLHASVDHTGVPGVPAALSNDFVGCVAQRTTNQTGIATVTPTAISFTAADVLDTHAFHDPAVNASRITIPSGMAGKYRFQAYVMWDVDATGYRQLFFRKNGTGYLDVDQGPAIAGGINSHSQLTSRPVAMAVGDYVEVYVEHNSGANRTIAAATLPAVFSAEYLGA